MKGGIADGFFFRLAVVGFILVLAVWIAQHAGGLTEREARVAFFLYGVTLTAVAASEWAWRRWR